MIELMGIPDDRVVGVRIDGHVDKAAFDQIIAEIEARSAHHEKLRIYAEIHSLGGMSLETLLADFKFAVKNWRRFDREAIVSDRRWLQGIAPVVDKLFPGIEVKAFALDDADAARAWVQEP
ncbi:SpoIIAA family protein [Alloalcanivorax mobilis]|uniref:STAS/SEC14 domain-containing protein n=1 Tax=Alloalcanivorax mobilis TaxID=2019569 RepID=UPI000C788DAA|nr:STAS/SEC14 domain-containing protein [Alloalcanivorax mobilis]